jgi:hypothetical protein
MYSSFCIFSVYIKVHSAYSEKTLKKFKKNVSSTAWCSLKRYITLKHGERLNYWPENQPGTNSHIVLDGQKKMVSQILIIHRISYKVEYLSKFESMFKADLD